MTAPIALLTDFGLVDPYVGIVEAVLLSVARAARTLHLTHGLSPGDVSAGAFWLAESRAYLPEGTVIFAVVDPGVGTARRALALRIGEHFVVAPDNGLLTDLLAAATNAFERIQAVAIDRERLGRIAPPPRGSTFHGRDIFAPAAGLLATGAALVALGVPVDPKELVRTPFNSKSPAEITVGPERAVVRVVDRFGNLITDSRWLGDHDPLVTVDGKRLRWVRTYGEAEQGELVALRGSFDTVELAVREGSAAERVG